MTSVWVGFQQGLVPMQPPTTRITVFGGTWPAEIWRNYMLKATAGLAPRGFPTPEVGYVSVAVDASQDPYCLPNPYTLPANIQTLQFIDGTQPTKACKTPTSSQVVTVPSVIGLPEADAQSALELAGFNVEIQVTHSTQPPGTVVYQTPSGGTDALQTSLVTITVSAASSAGG